MWVFDQGPLKGVCKAFPAVGEVSGWVFNLPLGLVFGGPKAIVDDVEDEDELGSGVIGGKLQRSQDGLV